MKLKFQSVINKFNAMKKSTKLILGFLICFGFIYAISVTGQSRKSLPKDIEGLKKHIEDVSIDVVRTHLKDFNGNAKFDNVSYKDGVGVCGRVNEKNRMGEYVGFKKFVVDDNAKVLLEGSQLQTYQLQILEKCWLQ